MQKSSDASYFRTLGKILNFQNLLVMVFVAVVAANGLAQRSLLRGYDYTKLDSHAINYPKEHYDNAALLAKNLCTGYESEYEKFRIIYRWITQNIDYKYGRNGTDPDEILRKGKGVCEGYASLLETMCHAVGLKCETVVGYSKSLVDYDIPLKMKETTHAWNAIFLLGEWHLVDVTWSAGTVDPKRRKFTREFDETWFLADPEFFIYSHYPADERWLLNKEPMKKRYFKKMPILTLNGFEAGIRPKGKKGFVKRKFHFQFKTKSEFEWIGIKLINEDGLVGLLAIRNGNLVKVEHTFEEREYGGFYLYMDGEAVLGFYKSR